MEAYNAFSDVKTARLFGYFLMFFAAGGGVFYTAWWAGLISFLNPEDAVKLVALLVALFIFLVIGFVGYVMAFTKPPAS